MGLCLLVVQPWVGKTHHRGVITTAHGFKHPQNHEELTHRNIEKLGEIRTPLLTARPALQNTTGS